MKHIRQKAATSQRMRRIGWLAGLVLIVALAISGLRPGLEALRQAMGIRSLLGAGGGLTNDELTNPFVCLRGGEDASLAQAAMNYLSDEYLRGMALCLAGEREAGLEMLKEAGRHSNAEVQYAVGMIAINPQVGSDILSERVEDHSDTWRMWLLGSERLKAAKDWQRALEWLEAGVASAPKEVRGSLYLQEGRFWQTRGEGRDYQAALSYYNLALEGGGWINPSDEAYAHMYQGEVYRNLKEEYSPEQALAEFQRALELLPGNYWVLLNIGHVYLLDLEDIDEAEIYYKQALAVDNKSPYAYFYLGETYQARGDSEAAADWYRKALERQPDWQAAIDRLQALEGK